MSAESYRVAFVPAHPGFNPTILALDEGQLTDLMSAMNYGSGWFRYEDGRDVNWFNLSNYKNVYIEPM